MTSKATKRLECLDGLRGIAALLVVLFHLSAGNEFGYQRLTEALLWPIRHGLRGLPLLLMLSGLLLTHVQIQNIKKERPFVFEAYLWARWWRIGLPYYAAVGLYLLTPSLAILIGRSSSTTEFVSFRHVGSHLSFLHGF
ncbi:hypothetical protein BH23PLA1_BH23PLA1_41560 [soil metagenome]